jgi:hypothetical protein
MCRFLRKMTRALMTRRLSNNHARSHRKHLPLPNAPWQAVSLLPKRLSEVDVCAFHQPHADVGRPEAVQRPGIASRSSFSLVRTKRALNSLIWLPGNTGSIRSGSGRSMEARGIDRSLLPFRLFGMALGRARSLSYGNTAPGMLLRTRPRAYRAPRFPGCARRSARPQR